MKTTNYFNEDTGLWEIVSVDESGFPLTEERLNDINAELEALEKADVLFRETDESNEFIEIDKECVLEMFDDDEDFEPTWEVDFKKSSYKIVEVDHVS